MYVAIADSFSAVNASYLGKNGAVTYLYKVIHTCGRKYLILLKTALDSLSYLVKSSKSRVNCVLSTYPDLQLQFSFK